MIDIQILKLSDTKLIPGFDTFAVYSGINALTQRIVKLLLTTKGSDYFTPLSGTNILNLYSVYNSNSIDQIKTILSEAITSLANDIIAEQTQDIADGKIYEKQDLLTSIIINSVEYDTTYSGWILNLTIKNQANDTVKIIVP